MARMTLLALSLTACVVSPDKDTPAPTTPRYTEAVLRESVSLPALDRVATSGTFTFDEHRQLRRMELFLERPDLPLYYGDTMKLGTEPDLGEADILLNLHTFDYKVRSEIQWDGDTVWLGFLDLELPYAYSLD